MIPPDLDLRFGEDGAVVAASRRVSMLDANEPPSCLAGGVTTRADVAPLIRSEP